MVSSDSVDNHVQPEFIFFTGRNTVFFLHLSWSNTKRLPNYFSSKINVRGLLVGKCFFRRLKNMCFKILRFFNRWTFLAIHIWGIYVLKTERRSPQKSVHNSFASSHSAIRLFAIKRPNIWSQHLPIICVPASKDDRKKWIIWVFVKCTSRCKICILMEKMPQFILWKCLFKMLKKSLG